MITLTLFLCNMALEPMKCSTMSPHASPRLQEPFKTSKDCNEQGKKDKEKLNLVFKNFGHDMEIKFRCTDWSPTA